MNTVYDTHIAWLAWHRVALAGACFLLHICCISACFVLLDRGGSLLIKIFLLEQVVTFQQFECIGASVGLCDDIVVKQVPVSAVRGFAFDAGAGVYTYMCICVLINLASHILYCLIHNKYCALLQLIPAGFS